MNPALEVADLCFGYGSEPVLSGVTFRVEPGESVGIVGANGSGKSTLLWCIAGLLRASGRIRIFGEPAGSRARRRLGMVFQNPEDQLFMPTLLQDLTLPLLHSGTPPETARREALDRLREFGLESYAERPATHLSLGQRKRAAIALALVRRPELLLFDEPTAELDGRAVRLLTATLGGIRAARVIASHHLSFLRRTTARVLVLSKGSIAAEGATGDVLDDHALLERAGLL